MLWPAVGIRQARQGIRAIGMRLVGTHHDISLGIVIGFSSSSFVGHRVGWWRGGASRRDLLDMLLHADNKVSERGSQTNVWQIRTACLAPGCSLD
jgi:hypothetical protein